jgi:hypothetical protein
MYTHVNVNVTFLQINEILRYEMKVLMQFVIKIRVNDIDFVMKYLLKFYCFSECWGHI